MTQTPRWTIQELRARYELEPILRDVFVEGEFDRELLSRCFQIEHKHTWNAYSIESVDIPIEILQKHNLTSGNKQRVIGLARELSTLPLHCLVRFFVDRDLDHWFSELERTPRLVWTSYCSLELHFYTEDLIMDVLHTTARVRPKSWPCLLESMTDILKNLYILRLADRELAWRMNWIRFEKLLGKSESRITLPIAELIQRVLQKNGKYAMRAQFEESVDSWKKRLHDTDSDPRYSIRGRDFIAVLAWSVRAFGGVREFTFERAIERLFILLAGECKEITEVLE
jgi:hypothetical protein